MKKTINIEELITLIEKELIKNKNKIENKLCVIEKFLNILEKTNNISEVIFQILLLLILLVITLSMPASVIASIMFSYKNVNLYNDFVIVLTGIPIPIALSVLTVKFFGCLGDTHDIISYYIFNFFNELTSGEEELFDFMYDKKHHLDNQLKELAWLKENYEYVSKKMMLDQKINKIKISKINRLLKKESLINVIFSFYNNQLNELRNKEAKEKETLKHNIIYTTEQVKEENKNIQQNINQKLENGERVRRIERYHVHEQAFERVEKKIKRLTLKNKD